MRDFSSPLQADDMLGTAVRLIHALLPLTPLFLVACSATHIATTNDLPVICAERPKNGNCDGTMPGFYYHYPSDTCRSFRYGSCHGPIPFTSREQCDQTCVARGK